MPTSRINHILIILAGLVSAVVLGVNFTLLPAQQAENQAAFDKLRLLQKALRAKATSNEAEAEALSRQLNGFDSLSQLTADFHEVVSENGLSLADAAFKPGAPIPGSVGISRVEISARMKGAYIPLKKSLAAILAMHPGLAVESLSMRRARASDPVADIDLRLSYFYRQ